MKKLMVFLIVIVFVAGLVFISDNAFAARKKEVKTEEKKPVVTPEAAKASVVAPEPKVVCKFKDEQAMAGFEQLYVSKQATFGRMGVLQAYFTMEQNNLAEIDKQMEEKFGFKMDPNKMYDLNRDTKEIREIGPAAPPAADNGRGETSTK